MNIFECRDYKKIIKNRVKFMASDRAGFSLKKVAARISIQYTYLSKALNDELTHLSEDDLFEICEFLNFFPDETRYVLILRNIACSKSEKRKTSLEGRLKRLVSSKQINAPVESHLDSGREIGFYLSPITWLVYFALGRSEFRENPRKLGTILNIESFQLKISLQTLCDLSLIEIGDSVYQIKKVNKNHFHTSPDHPLMRIHQQLLRSFCDSYFSKLPEKQKQRFMVTFNSNEETVSKIKELFSEFIRKSEKLVVSSPSTKTYQLNFELFNWF